jgi:flagellar export protein FliJ
VELNRGQRTAPRVDITALRTGEFYRNWLHHHIVDGTLHVAKQQARVQVEREKLGQVSARLKAIEKLRERRWSRYRKELDREEQALNDEAALRTFAARSPEAVA